MRNWKRLSLVVGAMLVLLVPVVALAAISNREGKPDAPINYYYERKL